MIILTWVAAPSVGESLLRGATGMLLLPDVGIIGAPRAPFRRLGSSRGPWGGSSKYRSSGRKL